MTRRGDPLRAAMTEDRDRHRRHWRTLLPGVQHGPPVDGVAGFYLAWTDQDGGGIEEAYYPLGEAVERGDVAQRWADHSGNPLGRRYEVRERIYGRVVWRAMVAHT